MNEEKNHNNIHENRAESEKEIKKNMERNRWNSTICSNTKQTDHKPIWVPMKRA